MTAFKPSLPTPPANLDLPTMYDLPSENPEEHGLPDLFHDWQPELLSLTFRPSTYPRDRVFSAKDLNLYYDADNPKYYKRPDWFGVVDVPRKLDDTRLSYVRWQEGRSPTIVVELLSPNTIEEDQGKTERGRTPPSKWEVYESVLQVPYYVLFDRITSKVQMFELQGTAYQELLQERLWISALCMSLGLWFGEFKDEERLWLRWYDADGNLIPTPEEYQSQRADQERQAKEQAEQRAEQERLRANLAEQEAQQADRRAQEAEQRAKALADRLRALGIDPETP